MNDMLINGPKGIVSFLSFFLDKSKNNEIIAPIIKDNIIFNMIFLKPSINPSIAMSFMSPPPIPPLDIKAIIVKNNPAAKKPIILSNWITGIPYIIKSKVIYRTIVIIIKNNKQSGII